MRVTVYDGKYTVIQDDRGGLRALRYGEEWRDCCGDGLILALAQEIEALRSEVASLREANSTWVALHGPMDESRPGRGNPYRHGCDPYVCPVCFTQGSGAHLNCNHPACPDGRDQ